MNSNPVHSKQKWSVKKKILISLLLVLLTAGFLVYYNFNRLLARALHNSFNASLLSDVYELKFENLLVNPFEGSIRVSDVTLQPREKPLHDYPYINSSFRLKANKLMLINVEIFTLLRSNKLKLDRILINKPDIEVALTGKRYIMLPFKDSTVTAAPNEVKNKKSLESFVLTEFQLIDASLHTTNAGKQREFNVRNLNISIYDLLIDQSPGQYHTSFSNVALSLGELNGYGEEGKRLQKISFKDFQIGIDSLTMNLTLDTLMYRFHDFNTGLRALDIQTADSIFHLTLKSFDLRYRPKTITLNGLSFKPNVSNATLQRKHPYQHTEFSGTIGTLLFADVNFDSLIYKKKIFIGEIILDSVSASIFKDKTKPIDKNRFPAYLGQAIKSIPVPVMIKHMKATHVQLVNVERKPDSTYAKVSIHRGTASVRNVTNRPSADDLVIQADAYLENKAHFKLGLEFSYRKPQFKFDGALERFNLPDLNALTLAYTPAKINKGVLDEIKFSGVAEQTQATGTMKFLYHNLEIDLELHEQAKWKSAIVTFAANTVLNSSNPVSADSPPRIVTFHAERDMNKGFINIIMKSMLNGLKETMIMSKENKKAHRDAKKKAKSKGN